MNETETEKNCYNCDYARKSGAKDMVACGFFFLEHRMDYEKTMKELSLENIYTGWGYMHKAVDDIRTGDEVPLGAGIMTNNVVVFDKNFCCNHHKYRKDKV
jgi:hypothetical protein